MDEIQVIEGSRKFLCSALIRSSIDELGKASATAQNLRYAITTFSKLEPNQVVYLLVQQGLIVGYVKTGEKNLWFGDVNERYICVLDFYVKEERKGSGLGLFDFMLRHLSMTVSQLAFDRPSKKLVNFLGKHYMVELTLYPNRFALVKKLK